MRPRRGVHDKSRDTTNAGHKAGHHRPTEVASMQRGRLADDWADAFGSHDAPDKECNAASWRDYSLEGEKMATS
jgi:hypothetical protein